jgi:hypothetical protein
MFGRRVGINVGNRETVHMNMTAALSLPTGRAHNRRSLREFGCDSGALAPGRAPSVDPGRA